MKRLLALLLVCTLSPAAHAEGGFLDVLRGVAGAIGGNQPAPAAPPQSVTPTLGIRGMDEGGAKAAAPAGDSIKLLESWAVGRGEAEAAAGRRGLKSRAASYQGAAKDATKPESPR